MIDILENTRVILKMVKGLFRNMFIWGRDLFWNIIKGRDSFASRQKSGRALYRIEGRGGVFLANVPSFFLLTRKTEEGGHRAPEALGPAALGLAAAGKEGERRRAAWGIVSPPRFEGWRPVEAAPRRRAAAGPGRCGGGAAGPRWKVGVGENGEGSDGSLLLSSPWAGVERGGRSTGGRRRGQKSLQRRRCRAREEGGWW